MLSLDDFKIEIKLNNKNSMVAQVQLIVEPLRIIGYRVMKSDHGDGFYVQPPSVKTGYNWLWLSKIDNPELWEQLQSKIKQEYLLEVEHSKSVPSVTSYDSIVNPDDIPF